MIGTSVGSYFRLAEYDVSVETYSAILVMRTFCKKGEFQFERKESLANLVMSRYLFPPSKHPGSLNSMHVRPLTLTLLHSTICWDA